MSESKRARLSTAGASVLLWVSRTLLALLVAYPMLSAVEATGIGNGPDRDAVLFRPDALMLLELIRVGAPWFASALKTALLLTALTLVLELAPLACALDMLCGGERNFRARAARSFAVFPRFCWLGAVAWLTQGGLLVAISLGEAALRSALHAADERALTVAPLGLVALGALTLLWVNSVLDLARAAVVERDLGGRSALIHALTVLRGQPLAVLGGSYASAAASAFAYLTAAWLMTRLNVGNGSAATIALAFGVHQLAVLFAITWRVRWLERALDLCAAAPLASMASSASSSKDLT